MLLGPLTVRVAATGTPTAAAGPQALPQRTARLPGHPPARRHHRGSRRRHAASPPTASARTSSRSAPGSASTPAPDAPTSPTAATPTPPGSAAKRAYQVEGPPRRRRPVPPAPRPRRGPRPGRPRRPPRALTLVTGTPFGQLRRDGGAWLTDGDRLDQILQCAIVDVAHLVTTASLAHGDHAAAQKAAELAIRVAPAEETPTTRPRRRPRRPRPPPRRRTTPPRPRSSTAATTKTTSPPNSPPAPNRSSTTTRSGSPAAGEHRPELRAGRSSRLTHRGF